MLNNNAQVKRIARKGRELTGVKRYLVGEKMLIKVDVTKATFQGKPYMSLTSIQRKNYEDLLYLANVQEGNPEIVYN